MRREPIPPHSAIQVYNPTVQRFAGEIPNASPGWIEQIGQFLGGGADKAKGAAKGANGRLMDLMKNHGGSAIKAGGALALLSAAGEFADTEDPVLRNASEAGGNLAGALGGAALGAKVGSIVPGIGTLIGAGVGGFVGSGAGSNIAGGVYDMFNNTSPEQRAREQMVKNAATQRQIMADDIRQQMLLQKDAMLMKRNDDFMRQERDLQVQNEYNYANAVNQAMLNAQQNSSMQQIAIAQAMMG